MVTAPDPRMSAGAWALERVAPIRSDEPSEITVVRDGAALLLRRGDGLVRVRPAPGGISVAEREVRLAGVLADHDVPVTALVGEGQPWVVERCVATGWRWTSGGEAPGPDGLGRLARTLRERTAGATAIGPVLDPIDAILGALAHLPADDLEAAWVRDRAAELARPWADAAGDDPLGRALVHGDLHVGNIVAGPDGPLLTDLELMGTGPSSYDAAPAAVAVTRYGADPAGREAFFDAFDADPRPWAGFATFVAIYELWVTAWAVGVRHQDPTWAAEASRRVRTLRDGADDPWTLR